MRPIRRPFGRPFGVPWLAFFVLVVLIVSTAGCDPTASPSTVPADPSATVAGEPTAVPTPDTLTVFFTDMNRFAEGKEPYEVGVTRQDNSDTDRPSAVLDAYFAGPTEAERARGLDVITSGFTGVVELRIEDGVAHVRLDGACESTGGTYTIAQPLRANLVQFADIAWVKIYDERGETEVPTGRSDSIPFCLEP